VAVVGAPPEGIPGERRNAEGQLRAFRDPVPEFKRQADVVPIAEVTEPRLYPEHRPVSTEDAGQAGIEELREAEHPRL
jgi:hypothetical protein